ncbi:MAG TPA: hypothetical protein VGM26_16585 [Rhizomicrobium sp.]|jgi:hypothetical protein
MKLIATIFMASFGIFAGAGQAIAEANWIRSDQQNAEAVSPVINGPAKLYIHINSKVQQHPWSFMVIQIPATGPTTGPGQQIGTEFTFGGAGDGYVRDAIIDVPVDGAISYRLKVIPKNGGTVQPSTSPVLFTEVEPGRGHELRRFNSTFLDHNHNLETWVDIHVMPR